MHAVIYTKKNRERLLNVNQKDINDWDCYSFCYSTRYTYREPLCYQICPDTENSKYWGANSYFLYISARILRKILKIFKLDIQPEPGYSFFYMFSKIFGIIIIILIFVIVYKIINRPIVKNKFKLKTNLKKKYK
jgi:hypothetical protein